MRFRTLLVVCILALGACRSGGDDTGGSPTSTAPTTTGAGITTTVADTTTTVADTTTTTGPLSDPRFPETVMSARFALAEDATAEGLPLDPASLLALFYRSPDGPLAMVITGFDPDSPAPQCGWMMVYFGGSDVMGSAPSNQSNWTSFSNQPWATPGATEEPRCEAEFLEDGALRTDIAPAVECGDHIIVIADQLAFEGLDAVATPWVRLLVDAATGTTVELEAIPWDAHLGANPNSGDLSEIEAAVLACEVGD